MNKETSVRKGKYKHYKGGLYQVIDVVRHSETEERLVLYKPLYDKQTQVPCDNQALWVRPFDMFFESVVHQGEKVSRFAYIAGQ